MCALSGCTGLFAQNDGGGGCAKRCNLLFPACLCFHTLGPPDGVAGMFHPHGREPQVTGDSLHARGEAAMFPGIAIAARRAAALAAVHPAPGAAVDGG
jgi:hypothetical protein